MLAEERHQIILQMLKSNNVVKLQDICGQTHCSESSARRDLQLLEEAGLLARVHGGAKIKYSLQRELDMTGKATRNTQEKAAIAAMAGEHIQAEDVIYLDAGTSTLALISSFTPDLKLTVVTNGVMHASLLADQNIRTILVGGELKNTTKAIVGVEAVETLKRFRFNKAFLGINGIHPKFGFTTPDPDEAAVKKIAIAQSEQVYVLADPTKFDAVSFVKVAEIGDATVITSKLPQGVAGQYSNQTTIQEVLT
ncbi:DeoR/GlpR family DNA-binding transcription regulator [Ligilactobacillus ubinensis]|uniref:DeoR/GlpR family DNA-binding transcription regulator n=1 Tax=Ligilactobacillus ubinensis TaxID=2876789 RepID=UPI00244800DA|nr:DeoR/GlpR family DNA-binding transcription regulator [Ligilactobacillus ubinensis]